ncbi:MAG: hypothetical protein HYX55_06445 [Chloroflexi bacterium]|nr:hypothetical protein [Chloroflexota bacterium]
MVRRLAALAMVAAFALTACGGSTLPGATQGPGSGATPAGPGGGTGGPGPTAGGGGGGGALLADVCTLLTVAEVGGALVSPPLTTETTAGDPAKCDYWIAKDDSALSLTIITKNGQAQFQALVDQNVGESVSGVGDGARYDSGGRLLAFMVSGYYVQLRAGYASDSDSTLKALTLLAKVLIARLTTGTVPPDLQVTAPPVTKATTACALLSDAQAASVIGKGQMADTSTTPEFCTYALASSGEVLLSTYFKRKGASSAWASVIGGLTADPVAGVGDDARFESFSGILYVLKGDSYFTVNVFSPDAGTVLASDRSLAEIMLGNL